MDLRGALVRLHRWAGLALALFLIIAGVTGSVIAFDHELDEWLNPDLFRVPSRGAPIPSLELASRLEAEHPRLRVTYVPLHAEPGESLLFGVAGREDPDTGAPHELGYNQVFLDPVTGEQLGEREWGACCLQRAQLIPFLYTLHYRLALPEVWGLWLWGVVGLVWMVDCFVGFAVTLPRRSRAVGDGEARAPFWRRWKQAWKVKLGARPYRVTFDVHRAAGLWFWGVLLTLAVSGVYLTLQFQVFRPLLSLVTTITPSPFEQPLPQHPAGGDQTTASLAGVVATATVEGARRGWPEPFDVFYSPEFRIYGVGFGDHHAPGMGVPWLYVDGRDGGVLGETIPGEGTPGDVFMQTMFPLHSGQILGLTGRIIISLTGIIVAVLSATGVVIWAKKRAGRRAVARRRATTDVRIDHNRALRDPGLPRVEPHHAAATPATHDRRVKVETQHI